MRHWARRGAPSAWLIVGQPLKSGRIFCRDWKVRHKMPCMNYFERNGQDRAIAAAALTAADPMKRLSP
jgi:hypothetical protein